jgi:hypothetical protein
MATLRFIKPWGDAKPGDIKNTDSPYTVHALVTTYGVAEIVGFDNTAGMPRIVPTTTAVAPEPEVPTAPKPIRRRKSDKGER